MWGKRISNRLTLRNAWEEFKDRFLNIDNTFFKTYRHLFTKPTKVIDGYIDGTRKKYINVFSYFAIALTLTGFQIFIVRKFYPESLEFPLGMGANMPEGFADIDWIYDFISIITLVNLPIYALVAKLTFIGHKKYNYVEQLVIMTYVFSQYSISTFPIILVAIPAGVNYYILGYCMFIPLFIYTAYVYTKLYQLSWGQIFLKGLLLGGIVLVCLLLLTLLQLIILIATEGFQEVIAVEKAKRSISYIASSLINWTS